MAKLTVKLRGEETTQLTLAKGIEYIAGRSPEAQIQLADERGISRHHLKFFERDGVWICEAMSKLVLIKKNGEAHQVIELTESCVFSVTPYEFYFEHEKDLLGSSSNRTESTAGHVSRDHLPVASATASHNSSYNSSFNSYNSDATVAGGGVNLVPYIRISFPNTADDEILKLEGHLWVGGRDANCEIPLDSAHVSRKHFELARTQEGFYLTDLGSSNGTKVNGDRLAPHEPKKLESGDEITIKSILLVFEIRDVNFTNRVSQLPAHVVNQPIHVAQESQNSAWPALNPGSEDPTVLRTPPDLQPQLSESPTGSRKINLAALKDPAKRTKLIRLTLIALLPILMYGLFKPESKPVAPAESKDMADRVGAVPNGSFDKLTPEQKSLVKDAFNLARNLYVQGKYELCLTELAKVHETIPLYENSKELESFCAQGKELVQRQRDLDRKERERIAIENQINGYVETCKSKLSPQASVDETRQCLSEAMELSPEHPMVVEMVHTAQMREEERQLLGQQRDAEKKRTARGNAHYNRAKNLYKEGKLVKAIAEYENFIDTYYPRMDDTKNTARREVASIKAELKKKIDALVDNCTGLGKKNQYKDAFYACEKTLKEDPGNESAKSTRKKAVSELKREMKVIYEDSVLEESLGNVDSAKEKWKKIVSEDIDSGEYALKAKSKLHKYGVD